MVAEVAVVEAVLVVASGGGSGGGDDGGGKTMVHSSGLLALEGFQAVCREHPECLNALLRNLRCLKTFIRDTLVDSFGSKKLT